MKLTLMIVVGTPVVAAFALRPYKGLDSDKALDAFQYELVQPLMVVLVALAVRWVL